MKQLNIVFFGLSITSSWGNGHATTFRSLIKALNRRGHQVTFFERDVPWYANHRDMPEPAFCQTVLYQELAELDKHRELINDADFIILGSYTPDAAALTDLIEKVSAPCFAFYDIDTPVTLAKLAKEECEYLTADDISRFDLYLSFTGGPTLEFLEQKYGARCAKPLYCSVDPELYYPEKDTERKYDLGYLGTYSDDRQPTVEELLLQPARQQSSLQMHVAGAQYPESVSWPANVLHSEHIPPHLHRHFYNEQRFTLNVTRQDMIRAGYSPSVRLFEAAACGTPIISDVWSGIDEFFSINDEILLARTHSDVTRYLNMSNAERATLGDNLRQKVLAHHTSEHRAQELENYWYELVAIDESVASVAAQ
ncbi:glycosyltransferase [Alteromonas pelagimontana]|uniref:Glycosyltransferase n=1 Tax=Alteromonas pelagimontana TaxID=1858656 RepID=A0A6M4MD80_9ALTE|nr:glycosyltransferase [Alteromonas pelagimontana]QJR80590.1 glycosyltransferase [Alteromonas pelagimontana]